MDSGSFRVNYLMDQPSAKEHIHDSPLYKIGRRIDFTAGKSQALRNLHLESDEKGNKTAFVFDGGTNLIGLLFAGHSETGVGYFTSAATLFEDTDVRLPLS
ncbi:uncharacterized protein BDCG_03764 [Blastomyces dermatitidis ER-3]|uniref:Uncharacterized protein n=3 Tax=Blastomyces TaxID=229219 RepID=A0A179UFV5_BLAGS|nr:uncharacterized protein BDBG_01796 [Blastomyces gilchristii SLH14081]XP_045275733.1 uncharacterized protein BDCG_03764 [Blastomyces dermatitidis ER-3]EEQ88644.2 hypothetical protein BDCG_03764 [Blastomyces dermatitidis ER-3]EGE77189.2 hypothetical protein BDDG_00126 [Blastomyces dermatitidis ATCC 18188]OAT05392.1 hypothetical protein BDBG_01796 [Blastomyces gilchristii SLH14081]